MPPTQKTPSTVSPLRRLAKAAWREVVFPLGIALLVIQFLIQAFQIPSGSMENTLLQRDFLLGLKFVYGSPIPFTDRKLPAISAPKVGDIIIFRYPGEPAYPDYDRGRYTHIANLLMFGNLYWDSRPEPGQKRLVHFTDGPKDFIKRCVASSGDSIEVREGKLIRNGHPTELPGKGKYESHTREPTVRDFLGPLHIPSPGDTLNLQGIPLEDLHRLRTLILQENPASRVELNLELSRDGKPANDFVFPDFRIACYGHKSWLISMMRMRLGPSDPRRMMLTAGDSLSASFPFSLIQETARSGYIPLEVPQGAFTRHIGYAWFDGDQLADLENNVALENLRDTSHHLELNAHITIDGTPINSYVIQQRVLFMMGDNRDNSMDSRYWGYLSQAGVKARALVIYWSFSNDDGVFRFSNPFSWLTIPFKIRWSRLGLLLDQ